MNQTISLNNFKAFIEDSQIKINEFKNAQASLAKFPELTREALELSSIKAAQATLANMVNNATSRINYDFIIKHVNFAEMMPFCSKKLQELMHQELSLGHMEQMNKLIDSEIPYVEILNSALDENGFNDTEFKKTMRIPASYNRDSIESEGFIQDVITVAHLLEEAQFTHQAIKTALMYLKGGDSIGFDIGIVVSKAQNNNITVKFTNSLVSKINETLITHNAHTI